MPLQRKEIDKAGLKHTSYLRIQYNMVTRNMQKVDRNRKQLSIQNIILYSCYDKIDEYIILVKRNIAFSSRSLTVVTKMHVVT